MLKILQCLSGLAGYFFRPARLLSRIFRGRLAGLAQIEAGGWPSRRLRGLCILKHYGAFISVIIMTYLALKGFRVQRIT